MLHSCFEAGEGACTPRLGILEAILKNLPPTMEIPHRKVYGWFKCWKTKILQCPPVRKKTNTDIGKLKGKHLRGITWYSSG